MIIALYSFELKNEKAQVILQQGVMRRLSLVAVSIKNLFSVLPPETVSIPDKETVDLATVFAQSILMNTYGTLDCWANVWAQEFEVVDKGGKALAPVRIGLGKKYKELRSSFPTKLNYYLKQRDTWITGLSGYRHALAHKIPPYIPPNMVDPKNEEEYLKLQSRWYNSLDQAERARLDKEMGDISHFKAYLAHDLETQPPIVLHWQALVDFKTLEELSLEFSKAIRDKQIALARRK